MSKTKIIAIVVLLLGIGTALMHTLGVDSEWVRLGDLGSIASLVGLLIWLLTPSKPVDHSSPSQTDMSIRQRGKKNTAINAPGNKGNISGGDIINTGIPVRHYDDKLEELFNAKKRIEGLEEALAQTPLKTNASGQETPQPTQEAKELAKLITDKDGLYARALKAIAEGQNSQADGLLDESQNLLNSVQEEKDRAQIKIYMARINNAYYAGRHRDALQWCDRLEPIAGDDSYILDTLGRVYCANAAYRKAEPLYKRSLAILEEALAPDHPDVAASLNNLSGAL